MEKGFRQINGARFYYEMDGNGPTLVLIHAGIADKRMWDNQFEALTGEFRLVRYDRRGFGQTVMTAGSYSHHQDLAALLDALGIDHAILAGCSQGAKTALDFALLHPEKTAALVLVAPAVSGLAFEGEAPQQAVEIVAAEQAGDMARVNELELQIWIDGPSRSSTQVDPVVRELVRAMNEIALRTPPGLGDERPLDPPAAGRLDEIQAPTLVMVGDLDTPQTLSAANFLTNRIQGARQVVIPGTAHLPNMEKPVEFNRLLRAFLNPLFQ